MGDTSKGVVKARRWFAVASIDSKAIGVCIRSGNSEYEVIGGALDRDACYQAVAREITPSDLRTMLAQSEAWYRQQIEVNQ